MPFWAVPGYLPSTDGPSHTYNAWVLGQLVGPAPEPAPLLRQYYYLNPEPVPNSLTHVALLALMWALPPAAAEKALLSLYVLLAAGALWYLAGAIDGERAWLALLGLPFVWNLLLGLGFYNYCFSVALFLLALAWWWRHRDRPGLAFAVVLDTLLVLCYFAHILGAVLALAGIGVLWLASWRRERWRGHLAHLVILVPGAALPFWFTVLPVRAARRGPFSGASSRTCGRNGNSWRSAGGPERSSPRCSRRGWFSPSCARASRGGARRRRGGGDGGARKTASWPSR